MQHILDQIMKICVLTSYKSNFHQPLSELPWAVHQPTILELPKYKRSKVVVTKETGSNRLNHLAVELWKILSATLMWEGDGGCSIPRLSSHQSYIYLPFLSQVLNRKRLSSSLHATPYLRMLASLAEHPATWTIPFKATACKQARSFFIDDIVRGICWQIAY